MTGCESLGGSVFHKAAHEVREALERSGSQIQVVDRAVDLLRVLGEADEPLGLREIARRSGLSVSTTRRVLSSLCHHGLCEQNASGRYGLGLLLFELGMRFESRLDIRVRSLPTLERLAEASQLTVFLCVRRDDRTIAIERIDGHYAFSLALTLGGSLPLYAGAASRVLASYLPESEVRRLLAEHPPTPFTEHTLTTVDALVTDLRESRKRGYVISNEDLTPGVAALGMPVFSHHSDTEPAAAISIAGLVPQVLGDGCERVLALLRESAEEISRELGQGLAGDRPVRAATKQEAVA
jgi:DNA-binding IclR family transcriptional regulator